MTVEVHLFDIKEELYGEDAIVFLYEFVRPEQKFESVEALKAQMERDIAAGKRYADKEI